MGNFFKKQIRAAYLDDRNSLTDAQVKEKSLKIFDRLKASNLIENKNNIFIYCSFKNEVDTYNIINSLLNCGKTVIVPYMFRDCNGLLTMQMRELKCIMELVEGPMGIPQPQPQPQPQPDLEPFESFGGFDANEIDAAIIPGVAFDMNHNRIGYGKGMYDKVLPLLNSNCLKIALAFEMQIMSDLIDYEEHDVKMDYIITENRIII